MEQTLADAPAVTRPTNQDAVRRPEILSLMTALHCALLVFTAVFLALHFVHLSADFPNHSPWMDWSKYTDEGWYGDGAIRQIQLKHWYVRGDFNPATALPVWPFIEFMLFSVTGVGLVAARSLAVAVFGVTLIATYVLVRRSSMDARAGSSLAAAAAVALLAASPFCFVFTRLAILEPLLVLLAMLALLAATLRQQWAVILSLGVIVPMLILTKTTAVFLLPSIAWMLWARSGYRVRAFLRIAVPAGALAAGLWASYFLLVVKPRFLEDYRYLFSANAYTGITRQNAWDVILTTLQDGMWMGSVLYPVAWVVTLIAIVCCRRAFRNPLVPSLMLWVVGYGAFLAYHNNLQPRYYLVVAVPLTILAVVLADEIYPAIAGLLAPAKPVARWGYGLIVGSIFIWIVSADARQTVGYVRSPEYTFVTAARNLQQAVLHDSDARNHLILSISGSDLSLMTGLPSICDDFGTMELPDRVAAYKPGWYATWNQVDDDKMDALSPMYHLQRVAEFPAFDDPERNLLILYRLDPPEAEAPSHKRRKPIPRSLQTKMGQQPSTSQLVH